MVLICLFYAHMGNRCITSSFGGNTLVPKPSFSLDFREVGRSYSPRKLHCDGGGGIVINSKKKKKSEG